MIKALFFDSGNVLVNDGYTQGIAQYEQQHAIPAGKLYAACHDHSYWKEFTLGNISEEIYWDRVAQNFTDNLNTSELRQHIIHAFTSNRELLEYIKTLQPSFILGIISNNPKEWFDYFWEQYGWDKVFAVKAISSYLHIRKPDARVFSRALEEAGVSGQEAVYVDDRADRVGGAHELGMRIVVFKGLEPLKEEIKNIK